jgi:hypothetical protein
MSSTNSWTGDAGNSNWDDPGNWSAGVVPSAGSADVSITKDGTYNVLIQPTDPAYTLRSLALGSATSTPTLIDDANLTVSTSVTLNGSSDLDVGTAGTVNFGSLSVASTSVVTDNGAVNIDDGTSGSGTIDVAGGELFADNIGGSLTYNLTSDGTATLTTDGTSSGTIDFADATADRLNLVVAEKSFNSAIMGFGGASDSVIDLESLAYSSSYTDFYSGSTLLINDGDSTKFVFTDINSAGPVFIKNDGNGGTELVSCFMAGTGILTDRGEVFVEDLSAGDLVKTNEGRIQPIRWLGRQTVSMRFADPLRVTPIRIKAGALGDGLPQRDLLLSPDHAVLIDDLLVQAGALVNGSSITRETQVPTIFTYYHVELEDHSLILANGVAAETFIDYVGRLSFDNWAEHESLYPGAGSIVEMALPRAQSHRQVPQYLRQKLQLRAIDLCGVTSAAA